MAADFDVPYTLIIPPLTDPTGPYHSISYLVGYCAKQGFSNFKALDANIDALNFMSAPKYVEDLSQLARETVSRIDCQTKISTKDQISYRIALQYLDIKSTDIQDAIAHMRNPGKFFNYHEYRTHAHRLRRWFKALSLYGIPGQFLDFRVNPYGPASPARICDLSDRGYIDSIVAPFRPYFEGSFKESILKSNPKVVGISVTYRSQLWYANWMAEQIKDWLPDSVICLGGADVTDLYKNSLRKSDIANVFRGVDLLVIGEGEKALHSILMCAASRGNISDIQNENIIDLNDVKELSSFVYTNLNAGEPLYNIWNYEKYWSPYPFVLYAPTRGCYWNKCTFCDYGLNFGTPTSPSRDRSIDLVIQDLKHILTITPYVYFSVDAISPSHLRKICEAVIREDLPIKWAGELRLEKSFQADEVASRLKSSGCVSISFGYESATQRILDMIDKGVQISRVAPLLTSLKNNGIAAQMMGFVGFPTETIEEGAQTYDFLLNSPNDWSLAGIGEFTLTSGAIVALKPAAFGISEVKYPPKDDVSRLRIWRETSNSEWRGMGNIQKYYSHKNRDIKRAELDRPFVGGIDSAHTIMFLDRYGPDFFRTTVESVCNDSDDSHSTEYIIPYAGINDFVDVDSIFWMSSKSLLKGESLGLEEYRKIYAEDSEADRFKTASPVKIKIALAGDITLSSSRKIF